MCGIAGAFPQSFYTTEVHLHRVTSILRSQENRGPDFCGFKRDEHCIIGCNRLSIVDQSSASNQPLSIQSKHIVFNGEIFNFVALRDELKGRGRKFDTIGDTEVLLQLYDEFGPSCVERLDGQFAFAIYDSVAEEIFLARDPFGIKPLYWSIHDRTFYFASSFKALLTQVGFRPNLNSLFEYFILRYVLPPDTISENVFQLEPGTYCIVGKESILHKKYWDIDSVESHYSYEEAVSRTYSLTSRSITAQFPYNVPSAVFLSGGLDSSIIAQQLSRPNRPIPAFSINFVGYSNEDNAYATKMANRLNSSLTVSNVGLGYEELSIRHMASIMDHPTGARDYIAMSLLSKSVRDSSSKTKIVYAGTGADEFFNGYMNSYFSSTSDTVDVESIDYKTMEYIKKYGFTSSQSMQLIEKIPFFHVEMFHDLIDKVKNKLLPIFKNSSQVDGINFHNAFYTRVHLSGWELPVLDDTTSHYSMEGRVPFVEKSIAELAFSTPGYYKYKAGVDKSLLRDAYRKSLPMEIVNRPKHPFSTQVMGFMEDALLKDRSLPVEDICTLFGIDRDIKQAMKKHGDLIWRVLILDLWMSENLGVDLREVFLSMGGRKRHLKSLFY